MAVLLGMLLRVMEDFMTPTGTRRLRSLNSISSNVSTETDQMIASLLGRLSFYTPARAGKKLELVVTAWSVCRSTR